ncbi:hypothetical protein K5I29_12005 [Flavobacterium agricola]|uniref:ATP synthase F1 complex delta/epsilon subunit N-terminal domain-containing protein n=1 Tax=Flavobacterium agricola TaxID=2870839 RepID=A0ABY6M1Q9_9FLAO|nr:hypothetical protein [Flavobacterium agricola]UYW01168.1 hypothetical protein K5I29_12005 [Flavobacterium agricola]
MIVEIVSPEATLFKGEVTSVAVPGVNGEFQMLNNHAPIVSLLTKGNVKLVGSNLAFEAGFADKFNKIDSSTFWLPINSGTLELNDNKIIILAD